MLAVRTERCADIGDCRVARNVDGRVVAAEDVAGLCRKCDIARRVSVFAKCDERIACGSNVVRQRELVNLRALPRAEICRVVRISDCRSVTAIKEIVRDV